MVVDVTNGVVSVLCDTLTRDSDAVRDTEDDKKDIVGQENHKQAPRPLQKPPAKWTNIVHFTRICGVVTLVIAALSGIAQYVVPVLLVQRRNRTLDTATGSDQDTVLGLYARASGVYTATNVAMDWAQYFIKEWIYVALPRSRLHPALLDSLAKAKMAELWSWNGNELRSIVQCAERATQIGIHDFVSYTALEFVSIVNLVSSTATMVSVPALLVLLIGGATIVRVFLSRMNALRGIQIHGGEMRQRIGKTMHDMFSGSLTVRVFGAYDYFGDRILRASEKEIAVQQIAMSILRTEALYRDAFEMLVTFVLIGMLQLGPRTTGAGSVQSYYNVLTDALPRIEYFSNIELKLRNHMLHLH
ncbi:hypothetical protein LPJ81_004785, partial [Coemansia sp. IMI 209127]